MYDVLIVGAGIAAATVCACIKHALKVCVVDVRSHLGGNCYDYPASGSFVHRYGPHIFHSTCPDVVDFLSHYTDWVPYSHRVDAVIEDGAQSKVVPFPYSSQTARALGRELTEQEIRDLFFLGYSAKMWGREWDRLPETIQGRVPKQNRTTSDYFPGQFVALPKCGYTRMMENMFDGVDMILGVSPHDWQTVPARKIVYCGRVDLIRCPGEMHTYAETSGLTLGYRSLDITFTAEDWTYTSPVVNFCARSPSWTRKTCFSRLTGGASKIVATESPRDGGESECAPTHPYPEEENLARYITLVDSIRRDFPNLVFLGRLGSYKYMDMFQVVAQARVLARDCLLR